MSLLNACVLVFVSAIVAVAQPSPCPPAPANAEQDVLRLEQHWLEVEEDPGALQSILADDFVHVLPQGVVTKGEQIAFLRQHSQPAPAGRHFDDLKVRVYGTAAVATGVVSSAAVTHPHKFFFTDVFAYRDGHWQAVSAQETAAAADTPTVPVTDILPAFWDFWDKAQDKPVPEQVKLFREMVIAKYPALFSQSVVSLKPASGPERDRALDQRLEKYLVDIRPYIPAMRKLSNELGASLQQYARQFQQEFPDYQPRTPVYFTLSLQQFDGATRLVDGKMALLFGVDEIARIHGPGELRVLFDHELFHQYHDQIAPELDADDSPLWMSLWEEGLATYVSQRMNPGKTVQEVLMFPHDLEQRAAPLLPKLAGELLENMDSKDKDEYAAFFFGQNKRADLPPRSGYYVGYRIAALLAGDQPLAEVAKWRGDALKEKVRTALRQFAAQK